MMVAPKRPPGRPEVPRRVLVYGRFQPFHRGHLSIALWALNELGFDEVVFLVGMASESYTPRNPFTAGERIEMIRLSARDAGIDAASIVTSAIPTLETNIGLAGYVLSYVPRVEAIATRNRVIARIFRDYGLAVVEPPEFNRGEWRGEAIRRLMARGDPAWKERVTPSTAAFIESIEGPERVRELMEASD